MNKVLRDYQREMLGRINEAWKSCRSVMVQMPTGTGKTVLMSEVIRSDFLIVVLKFSSFEHYYKHLLIGIIM